MEVDSDTAEDEKADEDMAATEADTNTGAAQRAEEDVVDTGMDTHTEPQAGDENAEDMDSDATLTDDTNDPVVEIPRLVVTMHFPANPPPTAAPATQAPATAAPAAPAPAITVPAFTTSRQWSRRFRDPNYQFACHRE